MTVVVKNISKFYKNVKALDDVTFEVPAGQLFGLIGPDGAGKSTLFRILVSLLIPDVGNATVIGLHTVRDFRKLRRRIGYMPGKFSLYRDLSVEENLKFFASVFHTTVRENYHLIEDIYVQLEPFRKRRADNLSGGMKQKLALCCALIHEPEILFLDEPTTGVDAVSRDEFWVMLRRLKERGMTIVVSTPYMDEASRCERVALIQHGRILKIDNPHALSAGYGKPLFSVRSTGMFPLLEDLRSAPFCQNAQRFGDSIHLTTTGERDMDLIIDFIKNREHKNIVVEPIEASVEDVFLDLVR